MTFQKYIHEQIGRKYCVLTSSGTAALAIALKISGEQQALMPSNTCHAVLAAIHLAGMRPVFGDIELQRYQMTPNTVESEALNGAVIGVNAFGMMNDWKGWEKQGVPFLIEDACLSLGASYEARPAGSFGACSILSFGYDKGIDLGGGGALLTDDEVIAKQAEKLVDKNKWFGPGRNLENQLNASIIKLEEDRTIRIQHAKMLDTMIGERTGMTRSAWRDSDFIWRYTFRCEKDSDDLVRKAMRIGAPMTHHYQPLHHLQTDVHCANVERHAKEVVNVLVKPSMTKSYFQQIANLIEDHEE